MIRVRFAPSPTGHLHIGGLRTALFNWLFARHQGGKFLLRIEDTDRERSNELFTQSILSSLSWCGLEPDEPPLIQSARIDEHRKVVKALLEKGAAYKCYCTQEEVRERLWQSKDVELGSIGYDGYCRKRAPLPKNVEGLPFVVRFKVPHEELLTYDDVIHGPISFDLHEFDDFVIQRSDGTPMYNLVVVVDDAFMHITHVIRGVDHISNTPKQILLYRACGYELPVFAHIPLILGPDGRRLSKRDAATAVLDYQKEGFLADALCNYLVRLGWAHGDQEIFTRAQMIELFDLKEVNKSGATFDKQKLLWVNSIYLKAQEPHEVLALIERDVDDEIRQKLGDWSTTTILQAIALYQPRVQTLKELVDELVLVYEGPHEIARADYEAAVSIDRASLMCALLAVLKNISVEHWEVDYLKDTIKHFCKEYFVKLADIAEPLRLALLGKTAAPGIFDLLALIGRQESVSRLEKFLQNN